MVYRFVRINLEFVSPRLKSRTNYCRHRNIRFLSLSIYFTRYSLSLSLSRCRIVQIRAITATAYLFFFSSCRPYWSQDQSRRRINVALRVHLSDPRDHRGFSPAGMNTHPLAHTFHVVFPRDFHVLVSVGFGWNRERRRHCGVNGKREREKGRRQGGRGSSEKERERSGEGVEPSVKFLSNWGATATSAQGWNPGYRPLQAPTLFFVTDCVLRSIGFSIEDTLAKRN